MSCDYVQSSFSSSLCTDLHPLITAISPAMSELCKKKKWRSNSTCNNKSWSFFASFYKQSKLLTLADWTMLNNLRASRLPQLLCTFFASTILFFGLFGQVLCTFLVSVLSLRTGFFQFPDCRGRNRTNSTRFRFPWRRGRPVESSDTTASPSINASQMLSSPAPPIWQQRKGTEGQKKMGTTGTAKPRRTCSRPLWAIGVLSLRFSCVILCSGDLPSPTAIVRSLLLRYFFASLVVPYFAIPFFRCFFSVVRMLRHFGLCYALGPLLSRTISGTFVAYPCWFVVPLFHCSSAGGCFLCLDWHFRLPRFSPSSSQLFVCSCWSSSFGAWGSIRPVLELGAQFVQFWSLELISTCKVFFQPFFLSCFFLNFFFSFYLLVVFQNVISCFPPKQKILVSFCFSKFMFFFHFIYLFIFLRIVYMFVVFYKIFVYWKK